MTGLWLALVIGCGGSTAPGQDAPVQTDGTEKKAKKAKGKGKAKAVEKVAIQITLLDTAAFAEGREPYFVQVDREVGAKAPQKNAVWMLFQGPTEEEKARGLDVVKSGAEGFEGFELKDGVATLKLRGGCASEGSTVTIYDLIRETLVAFPEVEHVKLLDPEGNTQSAEGAGDSRPECLEP